MNDLTVKMPDSQEVYSIEELPAQTSLIVQNARKNVLKNIELSDLVKGLGRCSELIYLAFNGVAGYKDLTIGMTVLHDRFGKICGTCETELNVFSAKSRQIQSILLDAFCFLYEGDVKFSFETMKKCSEVAKDLSARANVLAAEFEKIGEETVQILTRTEGQKNDDELAKERVARKIEEMKARTEAAKALQDRIAAGKKKYERMYKDAAAKAEDAENRAMTMAVLNSLIEPISAGIGGALAVFGGGAVTGAISGMAKGMQSSSASPVVGLEKARDDAEAMWNAAKSEAEPFVKSEGELKASLAAAEAQASDAQSKAAAARKAADAANESDKPKLDASAKTAESQARLAQEKAAQIKAEHATAEKALKEKQESCARREAEYKRAVDALSAAQAAPQPKNDPLSEAAASLRQEKSELFKLLQQKEEEEEKPIAEMQEYAIQIGLSKTEADALDVAINSLFLAIGALKKVVVVLRMAQQFWGQMASACEQLADTTLQSKIQHLLEKDFDQCLRMIGSNRFKLEVVGYYASWKAIEVVCDEYSAEASKIQNKVFHNFSTNLSTQEKRELAREMSERLIRESNDELAENTMARNELHKQMQEVALEESQPVSGI